jgi:MinD superfamily P-loop ATPase
MEIPFNRQIAELYSRGIPFVEEMHEWRQQFKDLYNHIMELTENGE